MKQDLLETRDALRARSRDLHNQTKAIAGRATAEKRDLSQREQTRLDALMQEFDDVARELDQVDREIAAQVADDASDYRAAMDAVPQRRMVPPEPRHGSVPGARSTSATSARRLPANNSAAEIFGRSANDPYNGAFPSLGDLALAVAGDRHDGRLVTNASMGEGTAERGGYLVPPQFMGEVLDAALEQEVIRPRALVLPMASATLAAPGFNYLDGTSGKRAGLQLLWSGESSTLTEQVAAARAVNFSAKKAAILVRVSSELAEDVQAFDRQLRTAMIAAVASGLDLAFMAGTGAGQPLGIIGSPGTISVAKESGQAAATILLQNLAKMLARLTPRSYSRAAWLVHPTTLPALYQMTVVIKNVAGTENVGGGAAAVTQAPDGSLRIFGLPVAVTDACSVLGTVGDIVLADLTQYAIGMRRDAVIQRADERYFETDEIGFKLTLRCDAQPLNASAIKLRDGTNTVSPFVVLETRA